MHNYPKAQLILEDGTVFNGYSFGYEESVAGEVVFNTAMTGYPESLTDPSYAGQILVATYPLIGNYGVPGNEPENGMLKFFESDKIQVTALIVSDYSEEYSHWNAERSLGNWLTSHKIPALFGIDTRSLTQLIREKGAMLGKVIINNKNVDLIDPNNQNLVAAVSCREKMIYGSGETKILLVDCGVKNNIIRHFLKRNTTVIRVPWDHEFRKEDYDGLFISNGPGNPKMCDTLINNLALALEDSKPIFGICLGNQLLALASGADTFKLKYGHRSHNQPVIEAGTDKAYITSQNHGFAIDMKTLLPDWEPYFINLNDGTNEGMRHKSKDVFSVQFHPEAASGPTDTEYLFDKFLNNIKARR